MPRSTATSKSRVRIERWWMSVGDEECPHCGMLYAYETEHRCPDCDEPTCMHCAVLHAERKICPECASAPQPKRAAKGRR